MQYSNAFILQSLILVITMSFTSLTTNAAPMQQQQQRRRQQRQQHLQQLDVSEESPQPHRRLRRSIANTFISAFPEEMREEWAAIRKRKSLTVAQMAMSAVAHGRQIGGDSIISQTVAETFMAAIRQGSRHEEDSSAGTGALKTDAQTLRLLLLRQQCRKLREAGAPEADRFCYFSGVDD